MVIIGVVSEKTERNIERFIRKIFVSCRFKTVIAQSGKITSEQIKSLSLAGVEFLIISMKKENIRPVYLDILILENISDISYELVKCVSCETRLIYNRDSCHLPEFKHPNAISYGMSYTAEATVSSVDDKFDGISFIYCLQRPVVSLNGNLLYAGEIPIAFSDVRSGINDILAAVTCGVICDVPAYRTVKI
jgi:hypothetical protein